MLKAVHFKTLETKELLSHKKAATGGVLRKLLLKVLQISQEKICARISFLTKSFKKRHQHRCFYANFAKFLRIPILKNIFERMLLTIFPFTYQKISGFGVVFRTLSNIYYEIKWRHHRGFTSS